jgi:hypothetical protein
MREKKQGVIDKQAEESKRFHATLNRLSGELGPRREKLRKLEAVTLSLDSKPKPKLLADELEGDVDKSLYGRWPKIIRAKSDVIRNMSLQLANTNDGLERVVTGYERKFGFTRKQVGDDSDKRRMPPPPPKPSTTTTTAMDPSCDKQ